MADDALRQRIRTEMTAALRAGDKIRLGTLRMLQAAVTNREKDVLHELSDDEVREVAGKEVKKRTESIEAFDAAGGAPSSPIGSVRSARSLPTTRLSSSPRRRSTR